MEWDIFNNVFVRWGKIYFSPVYRYIISLITRGRGRGQRLGGGDVSRLTGEQQPIEPTTMNKMMKKVKEAGQYINISSKSLRNGQWYAM